MTPSLPQLTVGGAVLCAVLPSAYLWGFSVDDAWIVTRVVDNARTSGSFSFNPGGPATDAVTPLGYAQLLAALTGLGGGEAFAVARLLGALAWGICVLLMSARLIRSNTSRLSWATLALCLLCVIPVHAWAGAGLEAPLVGSLVLLGFWGVESPKKSARRLGLFSLSAACAWRPELLPCSLVGAGLFLLRRGPLTQAASRGSLVLVLPALVALVRLWLFGSALPLSFSAKAPDLVSGLRYALGGLAFSGVTWFILLLPGSPRARVAQGIVGTHALALVFAGGDWMPFFRLYVPILPWLVWVSAAETQKLHWRWWGALALGLSGAALLVVGLGNSAREVLEQRQRWVSEGRRLLQGAEAIAAVDIGWVGRASQATIVDLAGVTDPKIAGLPGGHTSKAIAPGLFAARSVDAWVVRVRSSSAASTWPSQPLDAVYAVDARLLRGGADMDFTVAGTIELDRSGGAYVILRRLD